MSLPFALPPITEQGPQPIWKGENFQVGGDITNVLQYGANLQGWNDDLTFFHEESAGDHHFIDRASRDYAINQLERFLPKTSCTILEVGCSSGFMLQRIYQNFPQAMVMGSDVVNEPLQKLSNIMPNIPLFQFDLVRSPIPDNCMDAIVMLNVLEHIEDDGAALRQVYRMLKPGGVAIIEVPAGPHLYDIYDKTLMHYRRYTLKHLKQLIHDQGFKIETQSHLGFFLYPGFWWVKQRNKKLLSESNAFQHQHVGNSIRKTGTNKFMHALMQTELLLGKLISYPIGIRCLVTCVK